MEPQIGALIVTLAALVFLARNWIGASLLAASEHGGCSGGCFVAFIYLVMLIGVLVTGRDLLR